MSVVSFSEIGKTIPESNVKTRTMTRKRQRRRRRRKRAKKQTNIKSSTLPPRTREPRRAPARNQLFVKFYQ